MMETAVKHIALDLGSRESQLCVRTRQGEIIREDKLENAAIENALKSTEKGRVVLESSSEAFAVADIALLAGHEVNIVPSGLARTLGVGSRGVKTDKKDAQNLSMVSCRMENLPQVHLPSLQAREWRALLTSRAQVVAARTGMVNRVRSYLRSQLLKAPRGTRPDNFSDKIRPFLEETPQGLPMHIDCILTLIDNINQQIEKLDEQVASLVEGNEVCRRLMTVPGVGPITAANFFAAVDDVKRFKNAHAVESYFGMVPGENSSGKTTLRTGLTKAGSSHVRTVMVQAAWCAWRTKTHHPMTDWATRLTDRRPKQVAVTALARKMVGILFAIWRDGTTYDSQHGMKKQQ